MNHEKLIVTGKPRDRISQQSANMLVCFEKGMTSPKDIAQETGIPEKLIPGRIISLLYYGHLKLQRE